MKTLSWNIAAVNNNPFEYWITYPDQSYNQLMSDVQQFIQNPGEANQDITIGELFSDDMYDQLEQDMLTTLSWDQNDIDSVRKIYESDYKNRKIISEFITDDLIGQKRLTSMPDRLTNTISYTDESTGNVVELYRPTAINCYEQEFKDLADWWQQWREFMFNTDYNGKAIGSLMQPIKKAKYPMITESEEKVSKQLSLVCCAVFDAILVHMLDAIAKDTWQPIRQNLCLNLNKKKTDRIVSILETEYINTEVMFLQEVAESLQTSFKGSELLNEKYKLVLPAGDIAAKRAQNSAIALDKNIFDVNSISDISAKVEKNIFDLSGGAKSVPIAEGDLLALTVKVTECAEGEEPDEYMLVSFHGDTNGLATVPVLKGVHKVFEDLKEKHKSLKLVFGLDANTYFKEKPGKLQSMAQFIDEYSKLKLGSCYGLDHEKVKKENLVTTYNGRTFLQPQLNKAIKRDEIVKKGDVNQKDFILFNTDAESGFTLEENSFMRDNTGKQEFEEDMVFPTLDFPSDHAVISCNLNVNSKRWKSVV